VIRDAPDCAPSRSMWRVAKVALFLSHAHSRTGYRKRCWRASTGFDTGLVQFEIFDVQSHCLLRQLFCLVRKTLRASAAGLRFCKPECFTRPLRNAINSLFTLKIPGILAKYKVLPTLAERALAAAWAEPACRNLSPASCRSSGFFPHPQSYGLPGSAFTPSIVSSRLGRIEI
jgi:hypothetical protein